MVIQQDFFGSHEVPFVLSQLKTKVLVWMLSTF